MSLRRGRAGLTVVSRSNIKTVGPAGITVAITTDRTVVITKVIVVTVSAVATAGLAARRAGASGR